jgi:hypothetical protein
MKQAMTDCLTANARCLSLLRKGTDIEDCRYGWDYVQPATTVPSPLSDVRHSTQLLRLAAALHADEGNTDAAVACIRDGLHLAESLKGEPLLIAYLVRIACHGLQLQGLERVLSEAALTDGQLTELSDELAAVRRSVDLVEALAGERCFMLDCLRDPSLTPGAGGRTLLLPGMRGRTMVDVLDFMSDIIEAATLPVSARRARFQEIERELDGLSFLHAMIKTVAPAILRAAELDLRFRAGLDMAHTALAIERYRLVAGDLPQELAQLVPDHLDQVPIDPFDGRPIRYRRTDPGYLLYSVWEDGQDDDGVSRNEVHRNAPHDWPFRVVR